MEKWQKPYNDGYGYGRYGCDKKPYWNYDRVIKLYKREFPEIVGNLISHNWHQLSEQCYFCQKCDIRIYWGHDPAEYITIVSCPERCNEIVVRDIIL